VYLTTVFILNSPECVRMRRLRANCSIARKYVDSLLRLFRKTRALDFSFLLSCQCEFLRSHDFSRFGYCLGNPNKIRIEPSFTQCVRAM